MQLQQLDTDRLVASMADADESYCVLAEGLQPECYDDRVIHAHGASYKAFWGTFDQRGAFRIGVRGKVQAIHAVLHELMPDSIEGLVHRIVQHASSARENERLMASWKALQDLGPWPEQRKPNRNEFNRRNPRGQLKTLVATATQRDIPPAEAAPHLLNITGEFLAWSIRTAYPEDNPSDIVRNCMARDFSAPSQAAAALVEALGLDGTLNGTTRPRRSRITRARLAAASQIEPSLERYVRERGEVTHDDTSLHDTIEMVIERLSGAGAQRSGRGRLVVLGGGRHTGKKAVVGDVLVRLHQGSDAFLFHTADGVQMPIFATNARRQDYLTLALEVLVFLEGYGASNPGRQSFDRRLAEKRELLVGNAAHFTLEYLLEKIDQLLDRPALFIFTDVEGSQPDSVLKVLRNYGINRLLTTLLKNAENRILVTDSYANNLNYRAAAGSKFKPTIVPSPTIERLRWYISGHGPELDSIFARLSEKELRRRVSGRTLVVLSVLLRDMLDDTEAALGLVRECISGADERADQAGQSYDRDHAKELVRRFLIWCSSEGLLEAIAIICASEDGVTDRTLLRSLQRWPRMAEQEVVPTPMILDKLESLAKANPMLLRRGNVVYFDPEEYSFDEEGQRENWECSEDIAEVVRTVIAGDPAWARLGRTAHRQIAIAARRRAQLKKMRSGTVLGLVRNAEARDVQSYVAMLASIDPSTVPAGMTSQSLRLSGDLVFSHAFDPRTALRFAVQCQLKEDIDRDFRLTMVSDQDELRLRLYLLPFFGVGQRQNWSIDDLRRTRDLGAFGLTSTVPDHMKNAFTPAEIMDLLMTIVLAGFHCQFQAIMGLAYMMARRLVRKHRAQLHDATWRSQVVRMQCAIIDLRIQRGDRLRSALRAVERRAASILPEVDPRTLFSILQEEAGLERLKSWMRLRAREAELRWMLDRDDETIWPIYRSLYQIEHHVAEHIEQDDPVVLSGRTARRYIRSLCDDAPIYRTASRKELDAESTLTIRRMLEINISRLRRFGGADRIGVLVDMARRHHLEGNDSKAIEYAVTARERVLAGSISHGGKIDVISVHVALHLRCAESLLADKQIDRAKVHLATAAQDCGLLANLADAVEFAPSQSVAAYLRARLEYAQAEADRTSKHYRTHLNNAKTAIRHAMEILRTALVGGTEEWHVDDYVILGPMRPLEQYIMEALKLLHETADAPSVERN